MRQATCGVLLALAAACQSDPSWHLSSEPDDGLDMSPEAVARRARMNVSVHVIEGSVEEDRDVDVRSLARSYLLRDCFRLLADTPGGAPFTGTGCTSSDMVDQGASDSQNRPLFKSTTAAEITCA